MFSSMGLILETGLDSAREFGLCGFDNRRRASSCGKPQQRERRTRDHYPRSLLYSSVKDMRGAVGLLA